MFAILATMMLAPACDRGLDELRHEVEELREKAGTIDVSFDTSDEMVTVKEGDVLNLKFDGSLNSDNYSSLIAEVISDRGIETSVVTKSDVGNGWDVYLSDPEFDENGKLSNVPCVHFQSVPKTGDNAVLTVSAVDSKGRKSSSSINIFAPDTTPDCTGLSIVLDILDGYGAYIPELDPDETHLFIGIDDSEPMTWEQCVEEAHNIFLCFRPGDLAEVQEEGDDITINLMDLDKTLQAKLIFTAGKPVTRGEQAAGAAAVIGTMKIVMADGSDYDGIDARTYTFIRNSSLPESMANRESPYKVGYVLFRYEHGGMVGFDSRNLDFVCVRECSVGIPGIFLHLSNETLFSKGWDKTKEETCNFIRGGRAVEVSNLIRKDFPKYQAMFKNLRYCKPLEAATRYWTQEYKAIFFCTKHWAIEFGTGVYDWYDVQNKTYVYNKCTARIFNYDGVTRGECRLD